VQSGALNVQPGALIQDVNGNVNLFATAAAGASINFGANAAVTINTNGQSGGALQIIVDTNPLTITPVSGTIPGGFAQTLLNGGTVYWGNAGVLNSGASK